MRKGIVRVESARYAEFLAGIKDTLPLIIGAIPFAIIFGAVAVAGGLSPAATLGMSLFVFAGSAQFIGANLYGQGVSIAIIVLTTFLVNLRHALYSASLAPSVKHLSQKWLLPLAFMLTDETYAILIRRRQAQPDSPDFHWYYLGSALSMYLNWQFWTLVGILAGQQFQNLAALGLDFAMVVTFIGIVVPLIVSRPMLVSALVAGAVAILAHGLPHQMGLMAAAAAGIATGMIAESAVKRKQRE